MKMWKTITLILLQTQKIQEYKRKKLATHQIIQGYISLFGEKNFQITFRLRIEKE